MAFGEIVNIIEQKLPASGRVRMTPHATASDAEPALLVAATSKLELMGWMPEFDLDNGLNDAIAWWCAQLRSGGLINVAALQCPNSIPTSSPRMCPVAG